MEEGVEERRREGEGEGNVLERCREGVEEMEGRGREDGGNRWMRWREVWRRLREGWRRWREG